MDDTGILFLIICGVCFLLIGAAVYYLPIMAEYTNQETQIPTDVEYKNHLAGLNTGILSETNRTYTYNLMITNTYDNMSVRVYSFLFTDPENMTVYGELTSTIKNGTEILPLQSLVTTYTLHVYPNPYSEYGEYYIRVGCIMEGEDY